MDFLTYFFDFVKLLASIWKLSRTKILISKVIVVKKYDYINTGTRS